MIELEKRYRITSEEKVLIENVLPNWSKEKKVVDVVYGLSGEASMIEHGWVIRLRKKDNVAELQYKASKDKAFTKWEELAVKIDDIKTASEIMKKIGLTRGVVLDRIRKEAVYEGFKFVLDDFAVLGLFLEVEILDEGKSFEDALKILKLASRENVAPYGKLMSELLVEKPELREMFAGY